MERDNRMPELREIADEEMIRKARERGESHGFTGEFLDCFIERELTMMWKWNNRGLGNSTF
jgi:hypothetical protein